MNRVKQVVDYARNADLYVIVNIHWDGGWMNPVPEEKDAVNAKLTSLWTQIAEAFKGYDDHLLFAGTNEIALDWRQPPPENCQIQHSFHQTFVNSGRAAAGNTANPSTVRQGWATTNHPPLPD